MPETRSDKKRLIAQDGPITTTEAPPPKKQKTSSAAKAAGKNRRNQDPVIDLDSPDSYAAVRKLKSKNDAPDGFPRFHRGTVYIQLIELHQKYTYTVDKAIIQRFSDVLACHLERLITEVDYSLAETLKRRERLQFFFELQYIPRIGIWALVNVVSYLHFLVRPSVFRNYYTRTVNVESLTSLQPFTISKFPETEQPQIPSSVREVRKSIQTKTLDSQALPTPKSLHSTRSTGRPRSASINILEGLGSSGASQIDPRPAHYLSIEIPVSPALNFIKESATINNIISPEAGSTAQFQIPAKPESKGTEREITIKYGGIKEEEAAEGQPAIKEEIDDIVTVTTELATIVSTAIEDITTVTTEPVASTSTEVKKEIDDNVLATTGSVASTRTETKEKIDDKVLTTEPTAIPTAELTNEEPISQDSGFTNCSELATTKSAVISTSEPTNEKTMSEGAGFANENFLATAKPAVISTTELENGKSISQDSSSVADNSTATTPKYARYAHGEIPPNILTEKRGAEEFPPKHEINSAEYYHAVNAHDNLFRFFHNMEPEMDGFDISRALGQIEYIFTIAKPYNCLPLIHQNRHYLSNHLLQFGRELYKAILEDPPRWIRLSLHLECPSIFKEAIIHLVGQYPHYPWTTVPSFELPHSVLEVIHRKVNGLRILKASIDGELFKSLIAIDGKDLIFSTLEESHFDTWFIVQLWRDWFCHSLSTHADSKHESGSTYRLMARGSNAYLDNMEVYSSLADYKGKSFGSWDLRQVDEDLKIMKVFAQKTVKDLVVNHSMLDIEEAGIQHLTCIKVENDELPWIKKESG